MSLNFRNNEHGFTVLEMLISIVILVFISVAIYQATIETFRLRDVLSSEGDFYNGIRLSVNILQRDIELIYSPVIILPPKPELPVPADARDMEVIMSSELGRATKFWGAATDKTGVRPSRFEGTDSKLSFISASHIRMYKDAPESEFAKVTYELKRDESSVALPDTAVLIKTESPNVFEVDEKRDRAIRSYPILRGIRKLTYRFYHKEKDRWVSSWDSETEDLKNQYPDMIEIVLEVAGPSNLHFDGKYHLRPEIPLNGLDPST